MFLHCGWGWGLWPASPRVTLSLSRALGGDGSLGLLREELLPYKWGWVGGGSPSSLECTFLEGNFCNRDLAVGGVRCQWPVPSG